MKLFSLRSNAIPLTAPAAAGFGSRERVHPLRSAMRHPGAGILLLCLVSLAPLRARAGADDETATALLHTTAAEARDAYLRARTAERPARREMLLRQAVDAYAVLAESGVDSWALWANRGQCHLHLEEPGPASLAFLRALERNPRAAVAREGLLTAREQARLGNPPAGMPGFLETALFVHTRLSVAEAAWTLTFALAAFLLLLAIGIRTRSRIPLALAGLVLVLALGLGVSLGLRLGYAERTGIVIAREASLRSGPAESFPVIVRLKEAARVRVLESRAGWLRVEMDGGQTAWGRARELEEV